MNGTKKKKKRKKRKREKGVTSVSVLEMRKKEVKEKTRSRTVLQINKMRVLIYKCNDYGDQTVRQTR